jgi:hypothetical protein
MSETTIYFGAAALMLLLTPLVPKMIALRTRVLRCIHLNRLADWHERNQHALIVIVRSILLVMAVVLLILGLTGR